jgi:ligand-binding SRPBCC domain-containing protein
MPVHFLHHRQTVYAPPATVWEFFSSPRNLAKITPRELDFRVLSNPPARIHPGLMVLFQVRPLLHLPMTWLTEITHVEEGRYFVDEQRSGPYRIWHHEHRYEANPDGTVEMTDLVTYQLPLGWLSEPLHALIVKRQLDRIFRFRTEAVTALFPPPQTPV